ncbi:MAG: hypothetical protein AAF717_12540 [Bacteroidota bacterium]
MPANKKYLLQTRLGRTSKILAALLGGMTTSVLLHLVLALWIGRTYVVPISIVTFILLWIIFMVVVYWIEKPWKVWVVLLSIILLCTGMIFLAEL